MTTLTIDMLPEVNKSDLDGSEYFLIMKNGITSKVKVHTVLEIQNAVMGATSSLINERILDVAPMKLPNTRGIYVVGHPDPAIGTFIAYRQDGRVVVPAAAIGETHNFVVSADARYVVTTGFDGTVYAMDAYVYNGTTYVKTRIESFSPEQALIGGVAMSADGAHLIVSVSNKGLYHYQLINNVYVKQAPLETYTAYGYSPVTITADGRYVAAITADANSNPIAAVYKLGASGYSRIQDVTGFPNFPKRLAFSADGSTLVGVTQIAANTITVFQRLGDTFSKVNADVASAGTSFLLQGLSISANGTCIVVLDKGVVHQFVWTGSRYEATNIDLSAIAGTTITPTYAAINREGSELAVIYAEDFTRAMACRVAIFKRDPLTGSFTRSTDLANVTIKNPAMLTY